MTDYCVITAWSQDFVRALQDRPWIVRVLLKFIFGKYAYREFIGMVEAQEEINGILHYNMGYEDGLKGQDCHKEKMPYDFQVAIDKCYKTKKDKGIKN